ncbi:MAG TPA: polysaccharide deacetylase family protein [Pseudolabrys sp.]|jgi:peptidoglycan/xylan/chitin deacetylase (PgdA/CDA1 family)
MMRLIAFAAVAAMLPLAAAAEPCPGNPQALGTERVIVVDAATTPRVGRKEFAATLPLGPKELVLTFDDGPWPTTTPKVLDTLKSECVRATFFLVGRNAETHAGLVRRIMTEGHSVGHHTYAHPLLDHMPIEKAEAEIDRGIAADEFAATGQRRSNPTTPFFRFPGFASTPALLDRLQARGIVVFGADVWASDWLAMTPEKELQLILNRIAKVDHGIVLLHDTKAQTAQMLPALLRELKKRGYRIVHVVAGSNGPA